jgi:hypothetical protein
MNIDLATKRMVPSDLALTDFQGSLVEGRRRLIVAPVGQHFGQHLLTHRGS